MASRVEIKGADGTTDGGTVESAAGERAQGAVVELLVDRAVYAVDRAARTYRYARRNPNWALLDLTENERNKRSLHGYTRVFADGRSRVFSYRPPYTRPSAVRSRRRA